MAIELATNPMKLSLIKDKLVQNRLTCPLFNTELFTTRLEQAYRNVWQDYIKSA
jgi:predicted O-linked N-acetylglucosamine transferase (SPINDLY family)